jgi:hypothetical protein
MNEAPSTNFSKVDGHRENFWNLMFEYSLDVGVWNLEFPWGLLLGTWSFPW